MRDYGHLPPGRSHPRPWAIERIRQWAAGRGVTIRLTGDPDPHLFDDIDPAKAAAFPDGQEMTDEARYETGLNRSAVHTDVVIGGAGMTVTGTGPQGSVEIIRDDEWVLGER